MAGAGHVGINSTMGSVGSSPLLLRLVHLDMIDEEIVNIKTFQLCVTFRVLQ